MKTDPNKTAIIYLRYSPRPETAKGHEPSIEHQLDVCRRYLAALDLEELCFKADRMVSARKCRFRSREGGSKVLRLLEAGRAKHVCVMRLDRAFRSPRDGEDTIATLDKLGSSLHLAGEGGMMGDTSTADGRMFLRLKLAFLAYEPEKTAERTSQAMDSYQRSGRRMTRADRIRYGSELDPDSPINGKGIPTGVRDNLDELAVIEAMKTMRLKGASTYKIAAKLMEDGIMFRGKSWTARQVNRILKRELPRPPVGNGAS